MFLSNFLLLEIISRTSALSSVFWTPVFRYLLGNKLTDFLSALSQNYGKRLLASSFLSVRPPVCKPVCPSAWNNSAPTGRIFMKFDIWVLFEDLSRKLKCYYNLTGTSHGDLCSFMVRQRILVKMRNVSDDIIQNIKTSILYSVFFFIKSCLLWVTVGKYSTARQVTTDNIKRHSKDTICVPDN